MEEFCGQQFWDWNLTWYTAELYTSPDFTPCFQSTILVWIPALFLWIFTPFIIYNDWNLKSKCIPWNPLNVTKSFCTLILIILNFIILFHNIYLYYAVGEVTYPVQYITPIIKSATFVLALFMILHDKRKGICTSGMLFNFWFLSCACQIVIFRSQLRKNSSGDSEEPVETFGFVTEMISFPLGVAILILNCWAEPQLEFSQPKEIEPCPLQKSSYLSRLLFSWFDGFALKGYRKPLEYQDLWDLNNEDKSIVLSTQFDKIWRKLQEQQLPSKQHGKSNHPSTDQTSTTYKEVPNPVKARVSVLRVLFGVFGPTFILVTFIKIGQDLLVFIQPEILKLLIGFVSGNEEQWKGYLYAAIIFIVSVITTLIMAHNFHKILLIGLRIRTVLVSAIFRKALLLSNSARNSSTVGEIVNLMSVDAQRLQDMTMHLPILFTGPIQITVSMYFLWQTLGPSVLAGLGLMILLIPMNSFIATKTKTLQRTQMKLKDSRVKLMNEILSGIKVLKLYAWENSFQQQILQIRDKELKVLRHSAYLFSVLGFVWQCAPFLVSFVTFGTYVLLDEKNILDAQKAFVSLTLFNILKRPLTFLPLIISATIQATVSLKRLNNFMNAEEIDKDAVSHDTNEEDPIVIKDGTFTWANDNDTLALRNINIRIKEGSLCAIVGEVGSGKSSLLSAILGEMDKQSGHVNTKGTIAYVNQMPWIQNETLKDNVLFGSKYDWSKYNKAIDSCALKPDLEILPAGDNTEIGEKGINLSGGQKQRVSLARAVYNNADIYLLDDPLSAVDSHVGKHIFEKVVGPQGLLKRKTRLLVTHGITHLPQMDFIFVVSGGEITETGTYKELIAKKGDFSEFLIRHLESLEEVENGELSIIQDIEQIVGSSKTKEILTRQLSRSSDHGSVGKDFLRKRTISGQSEDRPTTPLEKMHSSSKNVFELQPPKHGEKLIEIEKSATGSTTKRIYMYYARSVGLRLTVCILMLYVIFEGSATASNFWLSDWSNQAPTPNGTQNIGARNLYLSVYAAFGAGQIIAILIAGVTIAYGTLKAASILHADMLKRILKAPSWFFDTTPTGRIVNRFGKDVDTIDTLLPDNWRDFLQCSFKVISTLIVITISSPLFIIVIIPTSVLYFFVQRYYVATSRQLKRLESVSRSPIYSHFTETINGATTIRAFGVQEKFISASEANVDYNQRAYYASIVSNRWLGIRLESIGNILILFVSLFAVLGRGTISPGLVGLSVSYVLQITMMLNFSVRCASVIEANMVAVERLKEYSEVPQEAAMEIESNKPTKDWPELGRVQFDGYQTRYREGLDLVLHDVTFKIEPAEKIGIVGRTGSGKSSLALGLFRLLEPTGGSITIDGKDISQIGLYDLRSRLTIIPQDPVLFSGTLRINLDPFTQYDDETVWRSLELAHLKSFVKGLNCGLSFEVSEGGQNLSVGQRQLICLARALLRKSKILVLDEATAQVDLDTDELIQQTIRSEFKDSTVLTIAHRLNTILDYTRVMVLDKGQVCEFDRPEILLKDKNSSFYKMAQDAGVVQ